MVDVLERAGPAGMRVADLAGAAFASRRTVERAVAALAGDGRVERVARGRVRLTAYGDAPPLPLAPAATAVWRALRSGRSRAYVSGMSALHGRLRGGAPSGPHLVVVEHGDRRRAARIMAEAGFVVACGAAEVVVADTSRLVRLVRRRSLPRRAAAHVAPPALAWIDLYRVARRGVADVPAADVRRLLDALRADPLVASRLSTLARDQYGVELEELLRGSVDA